MKVCECIFFLTALYRARPGTKKNGHPDTIHHLAPFAPIPIRPELLLRNGANSALICVLHSVVNSAIPAKSVASSSTYCKECKGRTKSTSAVVSLLHAAVLSWCLTARQSHRTKTQQQQRNTRESNETEPK